MLFLSFIRFLFEGGTFYSIFHRVESGVFLGAVALLCGIVFCEIKAIIQSKVLGALLFGAVSTQLFVLCLFINSFLTGGAVKKMPDDMYVFFILIFTPLLSAIYFGMVGKTPNKKINKDT
jgi:hypothetical protein